MNKAQRERDTSFPSEVLGKIIPCIVTRAQPNKIILFGSAARGGIARGGIDPNSDVILLAVKAGYIDHVWRCGGCVKLGQQIVHRHLAGELGFREL